MQIHCPVDHVTAMTVNTVIDLSEDIFLKFPLKLIEQKKRLTFFRKQMVAGVTVYIDLSLQWR